VDNVIAELEHSDRIRQFTLRVDCHSTSQNENFWTAMQAPFPELTILCLSLPFIPVPVLPDSFLGGSAPRLRYFYLIAVPFPGLPKLLLSATHLVNLYLHDIPHSGYISPEAMVTCLSMLTSLETLQLGFKSPQSCPDQENRRSPPPTRSILPALTTFWFKGVNEYLEDLVSCIDSHRLYRLLTTFFNDIDFNTPELNQFISRTPMFGAFNEAHLMFCDREALVRLQSHPERSGDGTVEVNILCQVTDCQLSSLAQICTLLSHLLLTMEKLYIYEKPLYSPPNWKDNIENIEWLDLLFPFTAVKNLYLSKQFSPRIASALQELTGGRTTEVLPALQKVLLEGFQPSKPVQEGIAQFISARQLTNRPVAISIWEGSVESWPAEHTLPLHLAPWLAPNFTNTERPHVVWNVSRPPSTAKRISGKDVIVDMRDAFSSDATAVFPETDEISIVCDMGLGGQDMWPPTRIRKRDGKVTSGDVFWAIYEFFQKPITIDEVDIIRGRSEDDYRRLLEACYRRCERTPGLADITRRQGVKRVDCLEDRTAWWGMIPVRGADGSWSLRLQVGLMASSRT
jgi:hypothetical protein